MNGGTAISPVFTNNFCMCGHAYAVHNLAVSPNTCAMCVPKGGGGLNIHDFTSEMEIWPASEFPQTLPVGYVSPGGFGTSFVLIANAVTTKPSPVIFVPSPAAAGVKVGMTMTVYMGGAPSSSQASYTVTGVQANSVTIAPIPGTLFNIAVGTPILFQGADGSTMGPGLPPNGQRAG